MVEVIPNVVIPETLSCETEAIPPITLSAIPALSA